MIMDIQMDSIYRCPVCRLGLKKKEKQYLCDKGHSFDISQSNYVNLLIDNQKKTKDPGDSKEMMDSRKNFLNREYYRVFSDYMNEIVRRNMDGNSVILDAGCGEGYFIARLKEALSSEVYSLDKLQYYGIDISKSAIKSASKRDKSISFAVASTFHLPIQDASVGLIIRNFAPGDEKEFHRVLKEEGRLLIVTPGVNHLYELKEALYQKARKHEAKIEDPVGFKHIKHDELQYCIELDNNVDIKNLVSMTPYYWSITTEMRNNLDQILSLKTSIHVNFDMYIKII